MVRDLPEDTHAVALGVAGESDLAALEEALQRADLAHVAVREPDAPWRGALMAIGLAPAFKTSRLREVMSTFRLIP